MLVWRKVELISTSCCSNSHSLATLRLFPGITTATVKAFFMPPIRGVVLETFGAGNAPQRADMMQVLKEACDRGVVVVAISQCAKGSVSNAYETGRTLLQAGVIPGSDMTPEVSIKSPCISNCDVTNSHFVGLVCFDETELPLIQTGILS